MQAASYNIHKAIGLAGRRDPDRIADVLGEIDADVVVLQEADKRLGSREGGLSLDHLETELNLTPCDVSVRPLRHGWQGKAIFLKPHLLNHVSLRIDLPSTEPLGAVSVQLSDPRLELIGMHLGLTTGIRRKQIGALENVLHRQDNPVLLAGDFNVWDASRVTFAAPVTVVS